MSNLMRPSPTRVVVKPWGQELIWAETEDYVGKLLTVNHGHKLSRQYHEVKEETIYILFGTLSLEIGEGDEMQELKLRKNECFHIKPGLIHRFCAEKGDVVLAEVSTYHPEDVVRLEDDYKR